MTFKDWISYLIKRWVSYMETPKEVRKQINNDSKENWSFRWFGVIPLSIKMIFSRQKR